jgi:ATP-dependent Lon protease
MAIFKNDGDDPEEGVEETTTASGDNVAPLLPLRDIVVFPHMVVPLFVGRARSIKALEHAVAGDRELLLSAQREAEKDEPGEEDVYRIGTLGSIIQLLRLPDGTVKILVEGKRRARIRGFTQSDPFFACEYETLDESEGSAVEVEALVRSVHAAFETYVKLNKKVPPEMLNTVAGISEPSRLADTIVAQLNLKIDERQHLLELVDANQRLEEVFGLMQAELEVLQVERGSRSRWSARRRSTTSTSRCGRSRRSWASATSSRTRSTSSSSSSSRRRCPTTRGRGPRRRSASSR